MSARVANNKRKLGSDRHAKSRQPPFKKSRRNAYNSDSDEEDNEVTARDAPAPDSKPTSNDKITSHSLPTPKAKEPQSILRAKDSQKKIRTAVIQEDAEQSNADTEDQTGSEDDHSIDGETDEFDVHATADSEASDPESDASEDSQPASGANRTKPKRRDPTAFATSISAILGSSLSRSKRVDPVLARSKDAAELSKALSESKLETKARKQLVAERRLAKEKGRVRDVLIGDRNAVVDVNGAGDDEKSGQSAAEILAAEKRLRKVAQRGVVHLFNAVRAAQVRGEEESKRVRTEGVIGISNRDSKVNEMSRNAFLDLVGAGGGRK